MLFKQVEGEEVGQGVTIGTIHAAKGLEWNTVFVMRCNEGHLPSVSWASSECIPEPRPSAAVLHALPAVETVREFPCNFGRSHLKQAVETQSHLSLPELDVTSCASIIVGMLGSFKGQNATQKRAKLLSYDWGQSLIGIRVVSRKGSGTSETIRRNTGWLMWQ